MLCGLCLSGYCPSEKKLSATAFVRLINNWYTVVFSEQTRYVSRLTTLYLFVLLVDEM